LAALETLATKYTSRENQNFPKVWDVLITRGGYGGCESTGSTRRVTELAEEVRKSSELKRIARKSVKGHDVAVDDFQRGAIADALGNQITVIQGPPGTGKIQVAVEILRHWVRDLGLSPVMLVSHNHTAVDNVAERLCDLGIKIVRFGHIDKVSPKLRSMCLYDNSFKTVQKFMGADVICTTNMGAGKSVFEQFRLKSSSKGLAAVLIDEAAQATELSALVPIINSRAKQVVLLGDHCQLPPLVTTAEAHKRGGALSLFQRLVENGLEAKLLQRQYRMHPLIAEFSSQTFYDGRIENGVSAEQRPAPKGFDWPNPCGGVAFVPCTGQQKSVGKSLVNEAESQLVVQLLDGFLEAGELAAKDIGIITPYAAQCMHLCQMVSQRYGQPMLNHLQISSVDGFQGREKELIIVSTVRSCNIGFLRDRKRLNVMLTRARRGLIVIGNADCLRTDPTLAKYLDWVESNSLVKSDLADDQWRQH